MSPCRPKQAGKGGTVGSDRDLVPRKSVKVKEQSEVKGGGGRVRSQSEKKIDGWLVVVNAVLASF